MVYSPGQQLHVLHALHVTDLGADPLDPGKQLILFGL